MLEFLARHKKATLVGIILSLVLIVAISVYFIIEDASKTADVQVIVAPSSATMTLNGVRYDAYGDLRVKPGEYEVKVSKDGFETVTEKIEAKENETVSIMIYLMPTEENADYYETHPEDATIRGSIDDARALAELNELKEKYPILKQLPIKIDYYTANYANRVKYTITYERTDSEQGFIIVVNDDTGGNYGAAMERIKALGFNPEDYQIQYNDLSGSTNWGHAE